MFDVTLAGGESYREFAAFRPGEQAVLAEAAGLRLGLTHLLRPALPAPLPRAGAGRRRGPDRALGLHRADRRAHWEVLLRARAIETGAFVLAPAQCGRHPATSGPSRQTWGHSLAVAPWGEVLVDAGEPVGVSFVEIDLDEVARARAMVPALDHDRDYAAP